MVKKQKQETFDNLKMVPTKMFEEVIDPTFHSNIRDLSTKVLGTPPPVDTLENLQRLYVNQTFQDLKAALLCLNEPMNIMQQV